MKADTDRRVRGPWQFTIGKFGTGAIHEYAPMPISPRATGLCYGPGFRARVVWGIHYSGGTGRVLMTQVPAYYQGFVVADRARTRPFVGQRVSLLD